MRAQAESQNQRIEFIKGELAMCSTFTVLATIKYVAGNPDSAERSMGHAEEVYTTVLPLVSYPQYSKHLSVEVIQEFTAALELLRKSLDGLIRKVRK